MTAPLEAFDPYLDDPPAPGRGCLEQLAAALEGFVLCFVVVAWLIVIRAAALGLWALR